MPVVCLVCGSSEDEVLKMHHFPSSAAKCKLWHESLGMTYPNVGMKNYRICSNHFTKNDYVDSVTWRLKSEALPTTVTISKENRNVLEEDIIGTEAITQVSVMAGPSREPLCNLPSSMGEPSNAEKKLKKSVFRGISDVSKMLSTPRKLKMIKLIESKETQVRRLKKLAKARAHNIKALSTLSDCDVTKELFKDLPSQTANFLISQVRCSRKSPKGRRWSMDEKVLALALFKRGPKCYRLLRKVVALPSKKTLMDILRQIPFGSGINTHMLEYINKSIQNEQDRICVIIMDEMDIKEHIEYDSHYDCIRGYEDTGESSKALASKALVFMLKGLQRCWKQPVAYYFSHDIVKGKTLCKIMTKVIEACQNIAKVEIVATINDCGTNNVNALKQIGSSVLNPYIFVGGKKIFTMYDPPHLLKCTVSLFRKHNLELEVPSLQNSVMQARFNDIRMAYEIDSKSPLIFRSMYKIKSHHMDPKMKYSMKVNLAAQIMSRSVSSFLYTLLARGELEQRSIATATFVQRVDELFDSFNGSCKTAPDGKELKCMLTKDSGHITYWKKAYTMVKNWKYLRRNKKGGFKKSKPPSQIAWLTTIKAMGQLWKHLLEEKKLESLKPRTLNQDAMENLFGGIRSGLGSNDNPTTVQFVGSLKTQILNGLIYLGSGRNCEEDEGILLTNLNNFISAEVPRKSSETSSSTEYPVKSTVNVDNLVADITNGVNSGSVATMSVAYVGGFVVKKILEKITDCQECKDSLITNSTAPHNLFINYKEWSHGQEKLVYPSEQPVISVGTAITLLEDFLGCNANIPDLSKHVEKHLKENIDFQWVNCPNHKEVIINSIIKGVWKIGIPWWCKRQMREIKEQKKLTASKKMQKFQHT